MLRIVSCLIVTVPFLLTLVMGMQDWNFVLHKFDYNTSDPDLLRLNFRTTRKEPGVYALNGTATLGIDIDEKFTIEVKIFRSPTGSGQYKITPYKVPKNQFCDFIMNYYIPMLQGDLKSCTNLPVYGDKCDKPIGKGVYPFNMCLVTNAGMPSHIQPGFYKIVAQLKSDDMEVWIALFAEAESKSMM